MQATTYHRRRFLGRAAMTSGALGLVPSLFGRAWAVDVRPPELVLFAYFEGGWDQLLSLDPRDPRTTSPQQHRIDPGYGQTGVGSRGIQRVGELSFGPSVPARFLRWADRFSIVRGINMDTAAHEVGRRFFITGQFPQGLAAVGSSIASELAAHLDDRSIIPHLSVAVEAYARGLPAYARPLQSASLTDLAVAVTPFSEESESVLTAVRAYQDQPASCLTQRLDNFGLASVLNDSVVRARSYLSGEIASLFDPNTPDKAELRARYGIEGVADTTDPRLLGFAAGQALKSGVSQVVSVRVARGLDTHSNWAGTQPPALEQGFEVLASILEDLEQTAGPNGDSLLEHTTVLAFSEFARTPLFNALNGRDHFLGNACLVAGPGLQAGKVIGGSAEVGMMPLDLELDTGRPRPDATEAMRATGEVTPIGPSHVLSTILRSLGAPQDILREPPIGALLG